MVYEWVKREKKCERSAGRCWLLFFFSFWSFNTPHSPHFHPNWWWTRNKKEFNIFVNFFHFTGANSEKHRQKFHLVCEVEKSYIYPRRRWSAWKRYFSPGLFLFTKWKSSSHEFQFAGVFWFFSSVFFLLLPLCSVNFNVKSWRVWNEIRYSKSVAPEPVALLFLSGFPAQFL